MHTPTPKEFCNVLIKQIDKYLSGLITKEELYAVSESYYSKFAVFCTDEVFKRYYLETIADACTIYIEEPGLSEQEREDGFKAVVEQAYYEMLKICKY